MARHGLRTARLHLIVMVALSGFCAGMPAQQPAGMSSQNAQPAAQTGTAQGSDSAQRSAQRKARLQAQRRARRLAAAQQRTVAPTSQPISASAGNQHARDQKILDQQKAQSAETARENDAVTQKVARERQQVQAEPRIQDAPGPGAQLLAGDPAIQPTQPADAPRIQDAPGPSQTPPPAPAPQP